MKDWMKKIGLASAFAVLLATAAWAAGYYPGFPAATTSDGSYPLQSTYSNVYDTGFSQGRQPQTVTVTLSQLRAFLYGNGETAVQTESGLATTTGRLSNILTEALSTANNAFAILTITNSNVIATSSLLCSLGYGTNPVPGALLSTVTPAVGAFTVQLVNKNGTSSLNGTMRVKCLQVE